jgi:hypothetical protein
MHIYQNANDQSKIEFLSKETHKIKTDSKGKQSKVKLDEDLLKFKYIESQTKQGKEVEFKRSEFERLFKQKMFVKC